MGGGVGTSRATRAADGPRRLREACARHLGPYGVTAAFEPGDLVIKDAAPLLGEVVSRRTTRAATFVGLDIGWNVNSSYFIYRYAQEMVTVRSTPSVTAHSS